VRPPPAPGAEHRSHPVRGVLLRAAISRIRTGAQATRPLGASAAPLLPQRTEPAQLLRVLDGARRRVPYYARRLPRFEVEPSRALEAFTGFPFRLTREELRRDTASFLDPDVAGRSVVIDSKDSTLRNLARLLRGGALIANRTAGSTGSPLHFVEERSSGLARFHAIVRELKYLGWREGEGFVLCAQRGMHSALGVADLALRTLGFRVFLFDRMDEQTCRRVAHLLRRKQPTALMGFPSCLSDMAGVLLEEGVRVPPPNFALCGGEVLFDHQRTRIERVFGCPVFDTYAAHELGGPLAIECPRRDGLHVFEATHLVETEADGEILVTTLDQCEMPLIKYKTGDRAELVVEKCACGVEGKKLRNLDGRIEDHLLDSQGRRVYASYLRQLLHEIDEGSAGPLEGAVFHQQGAACVRFELQPANQTRGPAALDAVARAIERDLGVPVEGRLVTALDRPSGKRRFVFREDVVREG
jgi:phenylacetate-CoA ligase